MKNKWGRRIGVFALAAISSICTINRNSLAVSAANRTWQFKYVENVQEWTVPYSGDYKIESYGGKGGDYADKKGGKGGKVTSTYTFQQGDVLKIYTGGNGNNPNGGWGNVAGAHTGNGGNDGGGATEVYVTRDGSTTRLMVAGGGGGANRDFDGLEGGPVYGAIGQATADGGHGGGATTGRNGKNVSQDQILFTWAPKTAQSHHFGDYEYGTLMTDNTGNWYTNYDIPDPANNNNYDWASNVQDRGFQYINTLNNSRGNGVYGTGKFVQGGTLSICSGLLPITTVTYVDGYTHKTNGVHFTCTFSSGDASLAFDQNNGTIYDTDQNYFPIDLNASEILIADQNGNLLKKITAQNIVDGYGTDGNELSPTTKLNYGLISSNLNSSMNYAYESFDVEETYVIPDGSNVTGVRIWINVHLNPNYYANMSNMDVSAQITSLYSGYGQSASGGQNMIFNNNEIDNLYHLKDYSSEHGVNDGNGYVKIESLHAHHYTSQITTAATCTTTGVRTYTCTGTATDPGCGDQYTEVIPALGHAYPADYSYSDSNGITNGLAYKNCTRCGTRLDSKWLNRIRVRYQNADGTFSEYTNVVNGYYYSGSNISWGRNADAAYQYAGMSWTSTTAAKSVDITVYRNVYYVDYAKGLTNNGGATGRTSHLYGSNVRLAGNGFEGRTYHLYFNANKPNNALGQVTSSRLSSLPGTQSGKLTFAYWGVQATYNGGNYRANTDLGAKNFEPANRTAHATAVWNNKVLSWGNPTLEGYTFTGWYYLDNSRANNSLTVTSAASAYNNTVYAHWRANTDTPYTVRHWIQKVTDSFKPDSDPKEYDLVDTEYLGGTTDTLVTPPTKPLTGKYAGCIAPALQSKILSGDGSMVIDYYYDRTKVTLDINGEYLIKQYVDQLDSEAQKKYYSNLGMSSTDTNNNMGTFDMYINNILVADDVRDYYNDQILYGSTWEIRDIKPDAGKHYYGSEVN